MHCLTEGQNGLFSQLSMFVGLQEEEKNAQSQPQQVRGQSPGVTAEGAMQVGGLALEPGLFPGGSRVGATTLWAGGAGASLCGIGEGGPGMHFFPGGLQCTLTLSGRLHLHRGDGLCIVPSLTANDLVSVIERKS